MDELPLTGERTVPGHAEEQYWFARHEAVYRWSRDVLTDTVRDGLIVDAGCGEGYGSALLARADSHRANATMVMGLEYDPFASVHAHRRYPEVHIVRANLVAMPLGAQTADAVVTLQVIEHLWDLPGFLRDCYRVLKPGGSLIASTPNRPVFSPGLGRHEKPTNPFHVEEFDAEQVHLLLADAGFADIQVFGLWHGDRLQKWELEHGSIIAAQVAAMERAHERGIPWPAHLLDFIATIAAQDFTICPLDVPFKGTDSDAPVSPDTCHDLIGTGVRRVG